MSITAAVIAAASLTKGLIEVGTSRVASREARQLADITRGDELRSDRLNLQEKDRELELGDRRLGHQGFMTSHRGQMLRDEQKRLEDTADMGQTAAATSTPLMGFAASKQRQLDNRARRQM